jgi:hypothetical protein
MQKLAFAAAAVLLGGALLVGTGTSQEGKKIKGMLPAGWKSLDLSASQKEKVYAIQATYKEKITALEKQLQDLRAQQSAEMVAVLTPAQRDALRRILLGELGSEPKKSEDKKDKE